MNSNKNNAFNEMEELLAGAGFSVHSFKIGHVEGSYSFVASSNRYVGGVCYWPESTFEFQFNSVDSEEVVLETRELNTTDLVKEFLSEFILTRLS